VRKFLRGDGGQDLIEYALLSALVGTLGIMAWGGIRAGIGNSYLGWDSGVQTLSACTPNPRAQWAAHGTGCPSPLTW